MGTQSKNLIKAYDRLAFLERVIDGLKPARELAFAELYDRWVRANFFEQLRELGFVTVSYASGPFKDFIPAAEDANRHQAIGLSLFISSIYANSDSMVEVPHELGRMFTATFTRISPSSVSYVNDAGTIVRFSFDSNKKSQF
jgi:hypothetical protein